MFFWLKKLNKYRKPAVNQANKEPTALYFMKQMVFSKVNNNVYLCIVNLFAMKAFKKHFFINNTILPYLCVILIVIFGCNNVKSSASESSKSVKQVSQTEKADSKTTTSSNAVNASTANSESIVNSFKNLADGELKKLTVSEILEYVKESKFVTMYAKYKNQKGEKLSKEESSLLNQNKLGLDYYVDNSGKIVEVRVRPKKLEDNLTQVQISEISTKSWKKYKAADIDCNNLPAILKEVSARDQKRSDTSIRRELDSTNAVIMVSIIENCGGGKIPSIDKLGPTGMNTIWLIFQHVDSGLRAYYYTTLMESAERGDLEMNKMALMQDRLLVGMQFKQWYGSQVVTSGLYPLDDPENVNKRREKMGMESIEEFLKKYNKTFDLEKEKLK